MCPSRDSAALNLSLDKIYMTTASMAMMATPIVFMMTASSTSVLYLSALWNLDMDVQAMDITARQHMLVHGRAMVTNYKRWLEKSMA